RSSGSSQRNAASLIWTDFASRFSASCVMARLLGVVIGGALRMNLEAAAASGKRRRGPGRQRAGRLSVARLPAAGGAKDAAEGQSLRRFCQRGAPEAALPQWGVSAI